MEQQHLELHEIGQETQVTLFVDWYVCFNNKPKWM